MNQATRQDEQGATGGGLFGKVAAAMVLMVLSYGIAHAVGIPPIGGFVIVMVGGAIAIYAIVAMADRVQQGRSLETLSELGLERLRHYKDTELNLLDRNVALIPKEVPASPLDPLFSGASIQPFALTKEEYAAGQVAIKVVGDHPPWPQAFQMIQTGVEAHRPQVATHLETLKGAHRTLFTFFGDVASFCPGFSPTDQEKPPDARIGAYWTRVGAAQKAMPKIWRTIRQAQIDLLPSFWDAVDSYRKAWEAFETACSEPAEPSPAGDVLKAAPEE